MTWRAWLALSFALFAACVWLMTLGGCASYVPSAPLTLNRGDRGPCSLPPEQDEGYVRTFCEESPDLSEVGCGYVGWEDGEQCLVVVESTDDCQTWKATGRACGAELRIMFSVRQD